MMAILHLQDHGTRRSWVANVRCGLDGSLRRQRYIEGKADFANANSVGTRGVRRTFVVEQDALLEIEDAGANRRYYAVHDGEGLIRLTSREATSWAHKAV
jgi:hypothetical protein